MTSALVPRPADPARCPATVYLAGLALTARRAQSTALRLIAGALAPGIDPLLVPWEAVRYGHVVAVRTWLQEQGYAPGTANRMLGALRGVVRAAWGLGLVGTEDRLRVDAVRGVPGSRLPPGRGLSPEEARGLLHACNARDSALVAVLYGAGLRAAEACSLGAGAFWLEGTLQVIGKGGKERLVPLPDWACGALAVWLSARGGWTGPLFPGPEDGRTLHPNSVGAAIERAGRRAGLGHVTPHDLRRSFVSNLLAGGLDLALVQRLVGHEDPRTTARYDRRWLEVARGRMAALMPLPGR